MAADQLPDALYVGTMCHCDDPDYCSDHWQFFTRVEWGQDGEHVRRGRELSPSEMRAVAFLVMNHIGGPA